MSRAAAVFILIFKCFISLSWIVGRGKRAGVLANPIGESAAVAKGTSTNEVVEMASRTEKRAVD